MELSSNDIEFFEKKGISIENIKQQIAFIKKGQIYIELTGAATLANGLISLDSLNHNTLIGYYEKARLAGQIEKFVPASGAASRMFQCISYFLQNFAVMTYQELLQLADTDKEIENLLLLFVNLEQLPFYSYLEHCFERQNLNFADAIANKNLKQIFDFLMTERGLGYQYKPKGLIPFHKYEHTSHNAFFEHLADAVIYCADEFSTAKIHFTISEQYFEEIEYSLNKLLTDFSSYNFDINLSFQQDSTNMISLDENGELVRLPNGEPLLRPAGHGALLNNLLLCKSDYIHLKNIDNVVPYNHNEELIIFRQLMTGLLIELKTSINLVIESIENGKQFERAICNELIAKYFNIDSSSMANDELFKLLNRPIRICGMVKNEGEPGGGPFFVKRSNSLFQKQIIEQAQVSETQKDIFKKGTHFNPVDIICSIKNHKGEQYNLYSFADNSMGIVLSKNYNGKKIQIGELPGLWNGSMADWLTVFIEMPVSTFNPVKTVLDLLRDEHLVK